MHWIDGRRKDILMSRLADSLREMGKKTDNSRHDNFPSRYTEERISDISEI